MLLRQQTDLSYNWAVDCAKLSITAALRRERQTSVRFHPVKEDDDEDADDDVSSPPHVEDNREHIVVTKVSLMFNPVPGIGKRDSSSSLLEPAKERKSFPQQNPELMEDPRTLLLLLHQRDLEIKGLKRAAQKEQFNHLSQILDELLRSKEKGPPKKSPIEIALQKEVDQLNNELKVVKYDHKKEMEDLENQLIKSRLHVLHLERALRNLSTKSESTVVLGEGSKSEVFELWSEKGSRITSDTSDLRLRRIPKHTSFVDAYHKFGNVDLSDEDKKEIITRLEAFAQKAQASSTTDESSVISSRFESLLPSEQSSMANISSQKSDPTSSVTETKTTESSLALPSETENTQQEKALDEWKLAQAGITIGQLTDGEKIVASTERSKSSSIKGGPVKIFSVHRRGKFVRIFNSSLNKEIDLSGYHVQQWVGGHPVSIYRFPSGTILPAQYHITIWSAAASLAHQQPLAELSGPRFFRAGPGCLTILYDHSGQVISQYANSHQFTTTAEAYYDNLDLSLDKFPLDSDDDEYEGTAYNELTMPSRDLLFFQQDQCKHAESDILVKRRYTRHFSIDSSATSKTLAARSIATKAKLRELNKDASASFVFSPKPPSTSVSDSSSSSSEGDYYAFRSWKPLLQEPETREFKTTLDTTLPMVSLIGQKSARSRYGFKYMTYMPTITDLHLRRYYK
ncbi:lamin tail domain-containing protein 2 isoform X1 [Anolis carolinensis]|uniref:lamin tail domain-containing protein 2 isoform X1 n=2 Tax=Anolis carolinensis TaxID=28377 RepID=UPI002F2B74DF